MVTIGELLRNARESKGIGLSKAEDDTKIRRKYLQALEDGKYDALPGRVYTKGFLRIYAKYLGLDEVEILKDFSHSLVTNVEVSKPSVSQFKKTQERAPKGSKRSTYLLTVATALTVLVVLIAYGYISRNAPQSTDVGGNPKTEVQADAGQVDKGKNDQSSTPSEQGKDVSTSVPGNENPVTQPTASTKVELKLVGNNQICWTKVTVDGTVAFQGNINPGDTKVFTGENIRLTLGKPGAVEVFQNGQSLGYLGPNDKVVHREFKVE